MKLAVVASLVASAAAFAPAPTGKASTALQSYENAFGVVDPTGYFDPLGLAKDIDQATFDQYRASELKVSQGRADDKGELLLYLTQFLSPTLPS
jgi:hypothetical protein